MNQQDVTQEIERLCEEGLDWIELSEAVGRQIHRIVDYDAACWHTMDPGTLLLTGNAVENIPEGGMPILAACEYGAEDVNKWAFLARNEATVGRLGVATQGQPTLSNRYLTLLQPGGLDRELRASFVDAGGCWGSAGFYRGPGEPDFSDEDEAFITSITRTVGLGYRRALVLDLLDEDHTSEGPGLVVLGPGNALEAASPAAEAWLGDLAGGPTSTSGLPLPLLAVAERVRDLVRRNTESDVSAAARLRTPQGEWLIIRATVLRGGDAGRIGVSIERAGAPEIAQIMISGYGLTEREQSVAYSVLRGESTKEIAEELVISPHTVQDHLKSIFRKLGVSSRRELVSRIYSAHYLPQVEAGRAPTPGGWFGSTLKATEVHTDA